MELQLVNSENQTSADIMVTDVKELSKYIDQSQLWTAYHYKFIVSDEWDYLDVFIDSLWNISITDEDYQAFFYINVEEVIFNDLAYSIDSYKRFLETRESMRNKTMNIVN